MWFVHVASTIKLVLIWCISKWKPPTCDMTKNVGCRRRWHFGPHRAKINRNYNDCWHIFSVNRSHTNGWWHYHLANIAHYLCHVHTRQCFFHLFYSVWFDTSFSPHDAHTNILFGGYFYESTNEKSSSNDENGV